MVLSQRRFISCTCRGRGPSGNVKDRFSDPDCGLHTDEMSSDAFELLWIIMLQASY